MASCSHWDEGEDGNNVTSDYTLDDHSQAEYAEDYYAMYTIENVPPGLNYLSYPSLSSRNPATPSEDFPYFHFAEFYRVVLEESVELDEDLKSIASDGGAVLALGTGLGGVGQVLDECEWLQKVSRIVATDIVQHQVECAKERVGPMVSSRVAFEVGDITNMVEYETGSFDMVFDEVCLSHLRGEYRCQLTPAAKEMHRVVKSGGLVVLSGYVKNGGLIDELVNELCEEGRFTELHRRDITENNEAGALASIEHMLGAGTLARMKEWMTSFPCETHEWDWDTEPCPDTDTVFKYKLFGKIAATLCDPDKLAAWIQDLKTRGDEATGPLDMPNNVQATGAVPAQHLETYGRMIDATMMGCLNVVQRARKLDKSAAKRCWVVTLQAN